MRSAYNKILEEFSTLEQNTKGQNLYIIKAIKILVFSNDRLENTIKEADKQSRKLEISNYRLQWAMLMVASLATAVVIYPYLKGVLISTNLAPKDWKVIINVLSAIFSAIIGGLIVAILTIAAFKRGAQRAQEIK